jgi:carbamoyl-phosphate synthase large subunit
VAQGLEKAGFSILATRGTADYLRKRGITVETVNKVIEGRPHIVDRITDMQVDLVINTVYGAESQKDSYSIRRTTLIKGIPYFTTISAAKAAVRGISAIKTRPLQVKSIQEYHTK